MMSKALSLFALLPLSTAHFLLKWPIARGFDDMKSVNFPCGGFDSVSSSRTDFPLNGAPVQLDMHHPQTRVEVLLSIGSDPGNNYNIVLRPTFAQEGLGNFCVGGVSLPSGLNVSDGTPATLQVVSNGDPNGGLYQCADVTLRTTSLSQSDYGSNCKNNTGIKITEENISGSPNGTSGDGGSTPSPSSSATGAANSAKPSGAASQLVVGTWLMGAVGLAGVALL